jgi:hypothetical protein
MPKQRTKAECRRLAKLHVGAIYKTPFGKYEFRTADNPSAPTVRSAEPTLRAAQAARKEALEYYADCYRRNVARVHA